MPFTGWALARKEEESFFLQLDSVVFERYQSSSFRFCLLSHIKGVKAMNSLYQYFLGDFGESVLNQERYRTTSVQFSHSVVSDSLQPHELQHTRPPCPSPTPGVHSNSCPLSRWCHPAISSCVVPFHSSHHQSLFQWVNSSHEVAKGLEFQL